jgi:hypothetical protein
MTEYLEGYKLSSTYLISFEDTNSVIIDLAASGLSASVVPLGFRREGDQDSLEGTAFCLTVLQNGEIIFATARHVIEDIIEDASIQIFLLLPRELAQVEKSTDWEGIPIRDVSAALTNSDVALLVANVTDYGYDAGKFRWFPITLGEPQVGRQCLGLGYPQRRGSMSFDMRASIGIIEEIHPNKRDSSVSTFPSFRTSALYMGAMSGGPIIDLDGGVIGIIARAFDTHDSDSGIGYGASIAAIAELGVKLHNENGESQELTVPQLVAMGLVRQHDQSIVRLDRAANGVTLTTDPPEMRGTEATELCL